MCVSTIGGILSLIRVSVRDGVVIGAGFVFCIFAGTLCVHVRRIADALQKIANK